MADPAVGDLPGVPRGKVALVGSDVEEIPLNLAAQFGETAVELSVTDCKLKRVNHLDGFKALKSLVLDNNEIGDDFSFPVISSLETLWMNHNNITRLDRLLDAIEGKFPALLYLSLLKNPCCPNYLVGKGSTDYKRYRVTVLSRLQSLKFLDSSPITAAEKAEAAELAKRLKRPDPSEYSKSGDQIVEADKGLDRVQTSDAEDGKSVAYGQSKYVYYGRHSEGNRFILDKHL